ncbi:MAG: glycosyltransferase [Bacilli bacterium]|nr:glycosyltransferase [Bacilli bacterium]
MDILYIASYPKKYFQEILDNSKILTSQPSQKFNRLFVEGFKKNKCNISVLLTHNHLKWETTKFFCKEEVINEEDVTYHFLPFIKEGHLNNYYMHCVIKKELKKWKKKHPKGVIVMDFLKPYSYQIAKHSKGFRLVTIVTDLPEYVIRHKGFMAKLKNKLEYSYYNKILKLSTHYVFLTEQMNEKLNLSCKPYCIIEGLVDSSSEEKSPLKANNGKKICLYSGALNRKYGVDTLIKAFMEDELKAYELHLYGNGDLESSLVQITKDYKNIKYFGIVANDYVVKMQRQATVLINPRPTKEDFTKYSFPSKNIEYMLSARPVVTTKLPGMPDEYLDFVYLIEDESVVGIVNKIIEILKLDDVELDSKGIKAREFVLKNKNNIVQTKRIIEMLEKNN